MRKLRKLSALLVFSLIMTGSISATNNNGLTEKETANTNSITESYSLSAVKETSGMFDSAKNKKFSFYVGYSGNFKNSGRDVEKDNKYNHIIELGGAYTRQSSSNFGYSLYAGTDALFRSNSFLVGPKAGANINYTLFIIGGEFIGYTDFNHAKPFFKPYVGVGVGPLKVTFGYNLGLANKATFKHDVNSFTLGVTIPLFWGGE